VFLKPFLTFKRKPVYEVSKNTVFSYENQRQIWQLCFLSRKPRCVQVPWILNSWGVHGTCKHTPTEYVLTLSFSEFHNSSHQLMNCIIQSVSDRWFSICRTSIVKLQTSVRECMIFIYPRTHSPSLNEVHSHPYVAPRTHNLSYRTHILTHTPTLRLIRVLPPSLTVPTDTNSRETTSIHNVTFTSTPISLHYL